MHVPDAWTTYYKTPTLRQKQNQNQNNNNNNNNNKEGSILHCQFSSSSIEVTCINSKITVLPQRSLGSTSAPLWSNKSTTSVRCWQAATWRAVRPSMSLKFTSPPESNSSFIPSKSPSFARYINRTVGSTASDPNSSSPESSPATSRSGAMEDCLPSEKRRWSFLLSIDLKKNWECRERERERERELELVAVKVGKMRVLERERFELFVQVVVAGATKEAKKMGKESFLLFCVVACLGGLYSSIWIL